MHRSRVGVVLVDVPEDAFAAAARFWAAAHDGSSTEAASVTADNPYHSLPSLPGGLMFEMQRTGAETAARLHLDIETDDVAAEVTRVRDLGAEVVERREGYTIMRDPAGLVFCVVPVQTGDDFERHATTWS